jgi:hypothetical protein
VRGVERIEDHHEQFHRDGLGVDHPDAVRLDHRADPRNVDQVAE